MTVFVALLRAVNVGGTGKIAMADLRAWAKAAGLGKPRTYIASGNLVFEADLSEAKVKAALEQVLKRETGKAAGVMIRTTAEIEKVLKANPFADKPGNRVVAHFLDKAPPKDAAERAKGAANEQIELGARELYVFYPDGQGRSKLKIAAAKDGTARNMNTIAKLAEMARE
jgi:uncharacterized protein (DUF1697 family)